jgi:DNA (cytosine-5)-methyltransferase 1
MGEKALNYIDYDYFLDKHYQNNISILNQKKISVVSLFSGCGGLDLGFEGGFYAPKSCVNNSEFIEREDGDNFLLKKNPFEIIFCNDVMNEAKLVWQSNMRSNAFYSTKSIQDITKSDLPNAELVIGGFPCQDFSLSGKRLGFGSERGRLYIEMARIINEIKPKAFVAENVYGLLSIQGAVETIKNEFEKIGYKVFYYPVEAQNYGIPQTRKRIFFVGVKESILAKSVVYTDFLPEPTHTEKWVSLNEVLKNLSEPSESIDPDQRSFSRAKYYGSKCQGNKAVDMTKPSPTIRAEHHGNIEFRRLENCGMDDDRRLTIREAAIIQTFPPNFCFTEKDGKKIISQSAAYKVLGNAVPPLLAYHFARRLSILWKEIFV